MSPEPKSSFQVIAENRTARHNFFILETIEAGIELLGSEVKSIRQGSVSLKEGYAHVDRGQVFLEGVHIAPYEFASASLSPVRPRRLLLHKREISRLGAEVKERRLTLVPLRIYFKKGMAKIELGLAKGKKLHDKREAIKERETRRELARVKSG
ncbi:MAG: SsrA-binding protein SmpB [Pseudomonadota bacterium]